MKIINVLFLDDDKIPIKIINFTEKGFDLWLELRGIEYHLWHDCYGSISCIMAKKTTTWKDIKRIAMDEIKLNTSIYNQC